MVGRKPAHLVSTARRVGGRQGIWQSIRQLHLFTIAELSNTTKQDPGTVRTYVRSLAAAGYLAVAEPAATGRRTFSTPAIYSLIRDVGVEAPRVRRDGTPCTQGAAREQMWRAMKILDRFSPRELAIAATTDDQAVADNDAADYVKNLLRAGYLVVVEPATKRTQARYRFVKTRNSGPLPPQVQRLNSIWDPNLRMVVWQEEPSE